MEERLSTRRVNYYRAMERVLRSYKSCRSILADYAIEPAERSHDISAAPSPGTEMRDRAELREEYVEARRTAYRRMQARYDEIDALVREYSRRPEFAVIRMYYFGERLDGSPRPEAERPPSWETLGAELGRSEKTLRRWRTRLVQEMAVTLFGAEAALGMETRQPETDETQ